MASKKYFIGHIHHENGVDIIPNIDMCNLPYDLFGDGFPLEFLSDIDMGKGEKSPLPDMAHVWIHGAFDCSTFTILDNTILPDKIVKLVCKHSLSDLGILIGKLPDTLQEIIVRPAVLNDVKNDETKRENAMRLLQMYPHIDVTDGKNKSLKAMLDEISIAKSAKISEPVTTEPVSIMAEAECKPDDWYSIDELADLCKKTLVPELLAGLPKDLDRYIKQAFNAKSGLKIEIREFKRNDNVAVRCVHAAAASDVVDWVLDAIQKDIERATCKKKTKTPAATKSKSTKTVTPALSELIHNGKVVVPVKIKKYVSKSVWKKIQSAIGKSTDTLLNVLQDIQDINVNPAMFGAVIFIKDNKIETSTNVEFKSAKCIAQGFHVLNDRARIVWGIDGNIFVCQDFFASHEGSDRNKYKQVIRNMDVDVSALDLKNDFLLVSDLIKELIAEKEARIASMDGSDVIDAPEAVQSSETTTPDAGVVPLETPAELSTKASVEAPVKASIESVPVQSAPVSETSKKRTKRSRITVNNIDEQIIVNTRHYKTPGTKLEYVAPTINITAPDAPSATAQTPDSGVMELSMVPVSESIPTQPNKEKIMSGKKPYYVPNGERKYHWASLYHLKARLIAQYNILSAQQQEKLRALAAASDTAQMLQITQELQGVLERKKKVESAMQEVEQKNQELHEFVQRIDEFIH